MAKPKVFLFGSLTDAQRERLETFCEPDYADGSFLSHAQLKARMADKQGAIVRASLTIDEEILSAAPQLRVVCHRAVGYNNFDLAAFARHGVIGCYTPGVLNDSVADLAMGLIVATGRRLCELDRWVKQGNWAKGVPEQATFGQDVHHTTLGIVGMGRIGACVARRAKLGFAMDILYADPRQNAAVEQELGATRVALETLLARSDYVVLFAAMTPENYHLIGAKELSLMKPTAVLINIARGPLVDEAALCSALQQQRIFAAAVDVYESEPVSPASPLLSCDNLITLPHIGTATARTRSEMADLAITSLQNILSGQPDANIIPELQHLPIPPVPESERRPLK